MYARKQVSDLTPTVADMDRQSAAGLARTVDELRTAIASGEQPGYVWFWHSTPRADGLLGPSCLSQWWIAPFDQLGLTFSTAEHYMMWRKATIFGDAAAADQVLATADPAQAKSIGRRVSGFDELVWLSHRWQVVVAGTFAKFSANDELRQFLLRTGDAVIAEASPVDTVWGIGLSQSDADVADPGRWRGLNLLGFALMEVRTLVREIEQIAMVAIPRVPDPHGIRHSVGRRLDKEYHGHEDHDGWHVEWTWGQQGGRCFLDLKIAHRHNGAYAEQIFADGEVRPVQAIDVR